MDSGKYQEALVRLDKLTAADEENYIYRYNRAVTLFNLKEFQAAIDDYKFLHELLPEQSEYVFQIGNAYEQLDSTKLAMDFYTKAISIDADYFIYFFKRGTLLLKQEKLSEAVQDFTVSIELNPSHHNSFHNRGIALYKAGKKASACEDWCKAVRLGNSFSSNHIKQNCKSYPCTF
jgi:tetratricopeptide (TPR) repeat protein